MQASRRASASVVAFVRTMRETRLVWNIKGVGFLFRLVALSSGYALIVEKETRPRHIGAIAMIVGVPKEIKQDEYRVAMLPVGVEELVRRGHQVLVEAGAGLGSGLPDHDYIREGAELVSGPEEIFARADIIVKVKEPQPAEWPLI